ncbi:MAG: class I SAM-dependent methyltransferase [Clostridiaceae bacterium]|nr:class I SAM-dependent methyltransferase [Clostridiaceae bacterium]
MEHLNVEEQFGVKGLSFSKSLKSFIDSFPEGEEMKVLDIGCGYGYKSLCLAYRGCSVVAIDIDPQKLAFLKQYTEKSNLKIQTIEGSMTNLPVPDHVFDVAICCSTIHHQKMTGIAKTVSEILRVLKPGGRVFFDMLSVNDPTYEIGEEIEPGTKVGGREGEEGVPHHYFTKEEVEEILTDYSKVDISEKKFSYDFNHKQYTCILFEVVATK